MASYYVLTPPAMTDAEKQTLFVRDGFSWIAFVFPLPWLVVRRLWLAAAMAAIGYLLAGLADEVWNLQALPLAYSLILSLWTGLEGGHVRAQALQRRGWTLRANVEARDLDEAEAFYFASLPTEGPAPSLMRLPAGGVGIHPGTNVALGLIGPAGGR
jgi:hypothetical protein